MALQYHEQALAIERSLHRRAGEAIQLTSIAICRADSKDWVVAAQSARQALDIDLSIGRLSGQIVEFGLLSECTEALGDLDQAVKWAFHALSVEEKLGRTAEATVRREQIARIVATSGARAGSGAAQRSDL